MVTTWNPPPDEPDERLGRTSLPGDEEARRRLAEEAVERYYRTLESMHPSPRTQRLIDNHRRKMRGLPPLPDPSRPWWRRLLRRR